MAGKATDIGSCMAGWLSSIVDGPKDMNQWAELLHRVSYSSLSATVESSTDKGAVVTTLGGTPFSCTRHNES